MTLLNLGRVAQAQGSTTKAAQLFAEGLALMRETPPPELHTAAIEGLAGVAGVPLVMGLVEVAKRLGLSSRGRRRWPLR